MIEEDTNILSVENELKQRKEDVFNFFKNKSNWIFYSILAFIVFVATYIRTLNISKLKDVTTGTWTLGPDLDPFLFLRWAKHIVENGSLMVVDTMRNVPLGYNTSGEMKLLSYLMAWFHNFLSFFLKDVSITYSAIIFPVFMFALTTIAFFLFVRKVFDKESEKVKNIIALIASSFFILIPSLLPRTIAGIPEKESAAFFFIFMAFYFFLEAFTSKKFVRGAIFAFLAGITTGMLALVWGGVTFVFMTIAAAVLFSFFLGKINKKEFYEYFLWIFGFVIIMLPFSTRYSFDRLLTSTSTGLVFIVLFILIIDLFIPKRFLKFSKLKDKIPEKVFSFVLAIILILIIASTILGPGFIIHKATEVVAKTVHPLDVSRFGLTVAENKQPYFIGDWKNNFGPIVFNIPLYFWLFFVGSVVLFNSLIEKMNRKEKIIITFSYFIFLIGLIFSKYSPNGVLDGDTGLSLLVYFGGVLFFIGCFGYYYFKRHREERAGIFKEFNFSYIVYFIIFTMTIVGARGAIRLVMVLGAVTPVAVAFLIIKSIQKYLKEKEEIMKFFFGIIMLVIIISSIFTLWYYYQAQKSSAENFAPGIYQFQWQKAMAWVRDNTPQDAVFAHWWDYGYWLQSLGERATIVDGGNAIVYWNHLMGRYVLTEPNEMNSIEFLYAHDGTHLLIDSTDIGKYTAYSSIGSNENYDRFSWISTFLQDDRQTIETKDEVQYFYPGGNALDDDVVWDFEGREIMLPKKVAAVGALILKRNDVEFLQPEAIFVYNNNQYRIPLRYLFVEKELIDFGSGLDAGIFVFPRLDSTSAGSAVNNLGAALYLSGRTVHSRLAELYLFDKPSNYFNLIHTEDSAIVESLKQQGLDNDFVFYQGLQGPIKIWEISYPSGIQKDDKYLELEYPSEDLRLAKEGEY